MAVLYASIAINKVDRPCICLVSSKIKDEGVWASEGNKMYDHLVPRNGPLQAPCRVTFLSFKSQPHVLCKYIDIPHIYVNPFFSHFTMHA